MKNVSTLSPRSQGVLRRQAEIALRRQETAVPPASQSDATTRHELEVHQIELEMQNSELRRAQQQLQEVCDRYEELYDFAPCAYLTLNSKGEILEANMAACSLLEVERRVLYGEKFTHYIKAESQDAFYFFGQLLLSSGRWERTELELKRKSSSRLAVRLDAVSKLQDGKAIGVQLGLTDVTDARRAEEQFQTNDKILTDFFETAPIGIQWLGADGLILKANRAQLDMLGYQHHEYVGRRLGDFEADRAVTRELAGLLTPNETLNNFRARLRHRDGSVRSVVIDANARWVDGKFAYFSVFTRDKLDQELLAISEREQRRIAHDLHDNLGQILAGTLHLTSALQKKLQRASRPEAEEEAYIVSLLDQALTETRGLARGLHPVKSETNGLMAALEELALRTKKHFNCPCLFQCPHEVLLNDDLVATHLYRIAQEALTNAVKHGKARNILIHLSEAMKRVTLRVEDDGRGLPKRRPARPGMGLRIMRYRADLINGTLTVQKGARGGTAVICSALAALG